MEEKDPMLKQVRAKVNDKDHEVLYKSPGPNPGGPGSKGRTWDFIQATSKEQAAQLIADGWSVSQEDAYDLADALEDGRKGGKKLVRKSKLAVEEDEEPDEEPGADEDDSEEDPILTAPPKKAKKKAKR